MGTSGKRGDYRLYQPITRSSIRRSFRDTILHHSSRVCMFAMNHRFVFAIAVACAPLFAASAQGWRMQPVAIPTRWAKDVTPDHVLPEYPRPQMMRPRWTNLNGLWHYAITTQEASAPTQYDG